MNPSMINLLNPFVKPSELVAITVWKSKQFQSVILSEVGKAFSGCLQSKIYPGVSVCLKWITNSSLLKTQQ